MSGAIFVTKTNIKTTIITIRFTRTRMKIFTLKKKED